MTSSAYTAEPKATVAHLASNHNPFDTRIMIKECQTLHGAGYDVTFIVPYDGTVKNHDGVRIRGVKEPTTRLGRMVITTWKVLTEALRAQAEIYHFHDPELIPVGILLKLRGRKVVYDVHEDVPRQILSKEWIPNWLRGIVARSFEVFEGAASRLFDTMIAATPPIQARFPESTTYLVRNFPIIKEVSMDTGTPYQDRPFVVSYIGTLMHVRGAIEMVEAIEKVVFPGVELVLGGAFFPKSLQRDIEILPGFTRTDYLGFLARPEVRLELSRARVGLVTLHPTANYIESLPVKLFEYMAAGIPVIASDFPLWRGIIDEAKCGLLVNPLDPCEIAEAIDWLMSNPEEAEAMGNRGRIAVETTFNWDSEANALLEAYESLTNRG